jgi:pimeloyl-ACP methyl ester carboxylesterase
MPASRIRLHVEDTGGDGRPVILIHGWPLSADAWKTQVSILRDAQYRVISYDRAALAVLTSRPTAMTTTRWRRTWPG